MIHPSAQTEVSLVAYRAPTQADAAGIHALIDECKPLDLNSVYCYMLLSTHFADTCVVAEHEGRLAGFLSSYRQPKQPSTLFVWQVAVSPNSRSLGVGRGLLDAILARPAVAGVESLETTITPSNAASWALFRSFARRHRAACSDEPFFAENDFGASGHEEERLLRISPIRAAIQGGNP
jgi:L-2,4-diaminobutyric acid acetyltransferase